VKRLSGWDAVLLYSETPNVHMHTIKVAVIELDAERLDFGVEGFRHVIAGRLSKLEPFCYQLIEVPFKFHHPMWREHCEVDLDYHIRPWRLPAPGGRRELDEAIGGSPALRWTVAVRCGRCTSSRVWRTTGSRWSARSTTRSPTASRRRT